MPLTDAPSATEETGPGDEANVEVPLGLPPLLLLAIAVLLPAVLYYFGLASSMALGTSVAAGCGIAAAAWQSARELQLLDWNRATLLVLVLAVAVCAHTAIAALLQPVDLTRALSSLGPLVLIAIGARGLAHVLASASGRSIDRAARVLLWLLLAVAALGIAGVGPTSAHVGPKPMFPFTEPSHFSLPFVCFLLYRCATSSGFRRLAWLLCGTAIALAMQNLTLLVGCALVALIALRTRALAVLGGTILLVFTFVALDPSYYADRLDFSSEGLNLSNLVYIQGWQMVEEALQQSSGWGQGFQQLGVHGTNVGASALIAALHGEDLNVLDGGFVLAKLVGEFGVFGVVLVAAYLVAAIRAAIALRRRPVDPARALAHAAIVAYSMELFIRGVGYFTGTALLLMASLWLLREKAPAVESSRGNTQDGASTRLDAPEAQSDV